MLGKGVEKRRKPLKGTRKQAGGSGKFVIFLYFESAWVGVLLLLGFCLPFYLPFLLQQRRDPLLGYIWLSALLLMARAQIYAITFKTETCRGRVEDMSDAYSIGRLYFPHPALCILS